ncbi:small ribosomal subunit protein mS35 [Brachionichthys hirsutus]|uniref:small ribosomal subunit protein mS35 n=1 Tax=Brachionichthys hirsutus TaxID=412623 RepID=UPI0036047C94
MASHTSKAFPILGRINQAGFGLQTSVSRATYATGVFIKTTKADEGFQGRKFTAAKKFRRDPGVYRTEKMPLDQDWTAVYPTAAPFNPNAVPLPVRMGYPVKGGAPPDRKGNLELIKIPNFLHLTPAAIKKHCEALKPFCTEWPSALDTDAKCDQFFPVKVESTDYVAAGPSVRNPAARRVHLSVNVSSLNLDDHARKKMLKLVGERYCKETNVLTITTDSCPLRQQNKDYALYLLTVLYHESWKTEAWEAEKTRADMEEYSWEGSQSQRTLLHLLGLREGEGKEVQEQLLERSEVQAYKDSVTRLKNEGDGESAILQYKDAVKSVLGL